VGKTVLRVVFDTNTFQPSEFDLLANGPLVHLCKTGRIRPVYGHVFLEELWRSYGNEEKRKHLIAKWIPFVIETVDRFCDDFITIWQRELVRGYGRKTNIFMKPRSQRNLLKNLRHIPADGSWRAWDLTREERSIEDEKRFAQYKQLKEIRKEIIEQSKSIGYSRRKHGEVLAFREFARGAIDYAGREFIMGYLQCSNPTAIANRWSRNIQDYPYFTSFIENMLYLGYYPGIRQNTKIDINGQADLDLMTHLLAADVIVSNEQGFLRQAFIDIWKPRGKKLFTSQEFADFIKLIGT
jgi:hypothetical protein